MDALEWEILSRLAAGGHVVSRLNTMRWFTYEHDGESFVVGPEMQLRLEQLAGAKLVEYTPAEFPMERALGFPPADMAQVRKALAAAAGMREADDQNGRS